MVMSFLVLCFDLRSTTLNAIIYTYVYLCVDIIILSLIFHDFSS